MRYSRSKPKQKGCLWTVITFPFYLIYFAVSLCGSFLLGVFTVLWELIKLPFIDYEYHVAEYLRTKGYWGVKVTQASGDYGIDITAHKHGKKYAIQCKYYSQPVGVAAIQEAVAGKVHYGCKEAMVITNNAFTKAAETLAAENGVKLLAGIK